MPSIAQLDSWIANPLHRSKLVKYFVLRGPFSPCMNARFWDFAGRDDPDPLVQYRASLVRARMDVFAIVCPIRSAEAITQSMDMLCPTLLRPLHELPQFIFLHNPHAKTRVTVVGAGSMSDQRKKVLDEGLDRMRSYLAEPQPISSAMDQFGVGHRDHVQRCTKHLERTTEAICMHTRHHEDMVIRDKSNAGVDWTQVANVNVTFPAHHLLSTLHSMLHTKIDMRLRNLLQFLDAAYNALINFLFQSSSKLKSREADAPALVEAISALRKYHTIDQAKMLRDCIRTQLVMTGTASLRTALTAAIKASVLEIQKQCGPSSETASDEWDGLGFNLFWRHLVDPPCPWLNRLPRLVQTAVVQVASAQRRHALLQMVFRVHHFFMAPMPWGRKLGPKLKGDGSSWRHSCMQLIFQK